MPGFDQVRSGAGQAAGGKTGKVPSASVLRFAPKAVLAPADILALQVTAGNQAVSALIEGRVSNSSQPPATTVPIVEGINDGSADLFTGKYTYLVVQGVTGGADAPATPAAEPAGPTPEAGAAPEPYDDWQSIPTRGRSAATSGPSGATPAKGGLYSENSPYASTMGTPPAPAPTRAPGGLYSENSPYASTMGTPPAPAAPTRAPGGLYSENSPYASTMGTPAAPTAAPGGLYSENSPYASTMGTPAAATAAPPQAEIAPVPQKPAKPARKPKRTRSDAITESYSSGGRSRSDAVGSQYPEGRSRAVATTSMYTSTKKRDVRYAREFTDGSSALQELYPDAKKKWEARGLTDVRGMYLCFGWSAEDCDKYLAKVKNLGTRKADKPLVAKLGEEDRASLELKGGGALTQGDSSEPYDTSESTTNFMGAGWAIFVMSPNGKVYAAPHKVGLFHHSSFLGEGSVAGAGELQVVGGTLKGITNKSGHYLPTAEEMIQVFAELKSRGVDLAGVEYIHGTASTFRNKTKWPGGAEAFFGDFMDHPELAPHR